MDKRRDVVICQQEVSDAMLQAFEKRGWHAYRMHEVD